MTQRSEEGHGAFITLIQTLATRTAELHRAFAMKSGLPAFEPEPFTAQDMEFSWKLGADTEVPVTQRRVYQLVDVVEARDDVTLYTHWPQPYAFAGSSTTPTDRRIRSALSSVVTVRNRVP